MKAVKAVLMILLWGVPLGAWAEWGRTAGDYIRLPFWGETQICPDGNGGCWVVGNDGAVRGDLTGIGVIHISHEGDTTWGEDIFQPFGERPSHGAIVINADNGDLIVAAEILLGQIDENGLPDSVTYFIQRINLNRERLWGEEGIRVDLGIRSILKGPIADTYLIDAVLGLQLINGEGELLWDEGVGWWEIGNEKVVVTSDQGVITVGSVQQYSSVRIVKVDMRGEIVWDRTYPAAWEVNLRGWRLSDLESDREGGVLIANKLVSFADPNDSLRYFALNVMRVSNNGDTAWVRKVYERQLDYGNRWRDIIDNYLQCDFIINYAGSGRFFAAWMDRPQHSAKSAKVVSLDVDGEYQWEEPVDVLVDAPIGFGRLVSVDSDSSVCYVWAEYYEPENDEDGWQQWGQRISIDGERLWENHGRAIQALNASQNGIITDGAGGAITQAEFNGSSTVQMVNRNGEIGEVLPVGVVGDFNNDPALPGAFSVELYPNPVNSHFRIVFDAAVPNQAFSYSLFDGAGRSVVAGEIQHGGAFEGDLSRLASGQYFLRLQSKEVTVTKGFRLVR